MISIEDFTDCFTIRPTDSVSCFLHKKEGIAFCCNCWRVICEDDSKICEKHIKKDIYSILKDVVTDEVVEKLASMDKRVLKNLVRDIKEAIYIRKQEIGKLKAKYKSYLSKKRKFKDLDPKDKETVVEFRRLFWEKADSAIKLASKDVASRRLMDFISEFRTRKMSPLMEMLFSEIYEKMIHTVSRTIPNLIYQYEYIINMSLSPDKLSLIASSYIKEIDRVIDGIKAEAEVAVGLFYKMKEAKYYIKELYNQSERVNSTDFMIRFVFYVVYSYCFVRARKYIKHLPTLENPVEAAWFVQKPCFSNMEALFANCEPMASKPIDIGLDCSIEGPSISLFINPCFLSIFNSFNEICIYDILFGKSYKYSPTIQISSFAASQRYIFVKNIRGTVFVHKIGEFVDDVAIFRHVSQNMYQDVMNDLCKKGVKSLEWFTITSCRDFKILREEQNISSPKSENRPLQDHIIFQYVQHPDFFTICDDKGYHMVVFTQSTENKEVVDVKGTPKYVFPSISEPDNLKKSIIVGQTILNHNNQTFNSLGEIKIKQDYNIIQLSKHIFLIYDSETRKWMTIRIIVP